MVDISPDIHTNGNVHVHTRKLHPHLGLSKGAEYDFLRLALSKGVVLVATPHYHRSLNLVSNSPTSHASLKSSA
jgi:hypothetical protein